VEKKFSNRQHHQQEEREARLEKQLWPRRQDKKEKAKQSTGKRTKPMTSGWWMAKVSLREWLREWRTMAASSPRFSPDGSSTHTSLFHLLCSSFFLLHFPSLSLIFTWLVNTLSPLPT
jgi:hypothetical protein